MNAQRCVWETNELLEAILQCLPTRDLLFAQRICKHWKSVVSESITLQRALFFEPNKEEPLILAVDDETSKKRWVRVHNNKDGELVKNPLLQPLFRTIESKGSDFSLGAGLPAAWRHQDASWRRMLPAQPAITTSTYIGLFGLPDFWCSWYTEKTMPLFCTKEMRMGTMFDQLDEQYGRFRKIVTG